MSSFPCLLQKFKAVFQSEWEGIQFCPECLYNSDALMHISSGERIDGPGVHIFPRIQTCKN